MMMAKKLPLIHWNHRPYFDMIEFILILGQRFEIVLSMSLKLLLQRLLVRNRDKICFSSKFELRSKRRQIVRWSWIVQQHLNEYIERGKIPRWNSTVKYIAITLLNEKPAVRFRIFASYNLAMLELVTASF